MPVIQCRYATAWNVTITRCWRNENQFTRQFTLVTGLPRPSVRDLYQQTTIYIMDKNSRIRQLSYGTLPTPTGGHNNNNNNNDDERRTVCASQCTFVRRGCHAAADQSGERGRLHSTNWEWRSWLCDDWRINLGASAKERRNKYLH